MVGRVLAVESNRPLFREAPGRVPQCDGRGWSMVLHVKHQICCSDRQPRPQAWSRLTVLGSAPLHFRPSAQAAEWPRYGTLTERGRGE